MKTSDGPVSPWWRHGMAWLVFAGPAIVVVASFVTLALVIIHPDPALNTSTTAQRAPAEDDDTSTQPAEIASRHAEPHRH
ncbi:MAG: hypothetical protein JO369_08770 [Paucibacter sp.]|nr:hypothetical protein [Roseateles sp.]